MNELSIDERRRRRRVPVDAVGRDRADAAQRARRERHEPGDAPRRKSSHSSSPPDGIAGHGGPSTLFDGGRIGQVGRTPVRRGRLRPGGLQPAGGGAARGERDERRLLGAAAVEGVRAARVEAAAARRPRRIGHLAGERLGQEARSVRVRHRRRSAPRCRGGAAASQTGSVGPVSTIVPRYITETASATWRTIARSCEMRSRPRPSSRERLDEQVRELRLRRGVERGERLVEHDHRRVGGERAGDRDALPLPAGELVREPVGGGRRQADELEQLRDAGRRGAARGRACRARRRAASPTLRRGLSDEYGFWKTSWSRTRSRGPARRRRAASTSRPRRRPSPTVAGTSPTAARASVDLPQPDSPTRPTICPARRVMLAPGDRAHAAAAAALVVDDDVA